MVAVLLGIKRMNNNEESPEGKKIRPLWAGRCEASPEGNALVSLRQKQLRPCIRRVGFDEAAYRYYSVAFLLNSTEGDNTRNFKNQITANIANFVGF